MFAGGKMIWAPVQAVSQGDWIYQIVSDNASVIDEDWEFQKVTMFFANGSIKMAVLVNQDHF
jgi:hypothetical protein